jgi:uncharacterized lipoprotein NlpE involved in copper resistance
MKNLLLLAALFILLCCKAKAQQRVTVDKAGNYTAVKRDPAQTAAKPTGHTITATDGTVYPVYESARGKLYYNRISKAGHAYKCYIKTN